MHCSLHFADPKLMFMKANRTIEEDTNIEIEHVVGRSVNNLHATVESEKGQLKTLTYCKQKAEPYYPPYASIL